MSDEAWLQAVRWSADGLIPAVAQDAASGRVLMLAWMNQESLKLSVSEGRAVYWSRSRQRLWRKGEESGHIQRLHEIRLDCDGDALLLIVEQVGSIACHTGRVSCFFSRLQGGQWEVVDPTIKTAQEIYGKSDSSDSGFGVP